MTVYLDDDFRCHVETAEGLTPYDTDFFDDKDPSVIPLYRVIPLGSSWARSDGVVFYGEMIALI